LPGIFLWAVFGIMVVAIVCVVLSIIVKILMLKYLAQRYYISVGFFNLKIHFFLNYIDILSYIRDLKSSIFTF
jgi:hypothetical protein